MIDGQNERDQRKDELRQEIKRTSQEKVMPWEASKLKESKQKFHGYHQLQPHLVLRSQLHNVYHRSAGIPNDHLGLEQLFQCLSTQRPIFHLLYRSNSTR